MLNKHLDHGQKIIQVIIHNINHQDQVHIKLIRQLMRMAIIFTVILEILVPVKLTHLNLTDLVMAQEENV